jgi:hypothetical protein
MPRGFWEDCFCFRFGPWGFWCGPYRPFRVSHHVTEGRHILRIYIDREVKREDIKARLVEPGVLEIEWPRRRRGEEILIE